MKTRTFDKKIWKFLKRSAKKKKKRSKIIFSDKESQQTNWWMFIYLFIFINFIELFIFNFRFWLQISPAFPYWYLNLLAFDAFFFIFFSVNLKKKKKTFWTAWLWISFFQVWMFSVRFSFRSFPLMAFFIFFIKFFNLPFCACLINFTFFFFFLLQILTLYFFASH